LKNILLILTDQQRKDALGCYNPNIDFTPNIDSLAENGVCFTNNFVANPVCTPNRISIFTGRYVKNHGVHSNGLITRKASPNIVEYLKGKGYQTASFGKIHFEPYTCDFIEDSRESFKYWNNKEAKLELPYYGFEIVELTVRHTAPVAHYGKWFYENGGTDEMLEFDEFKKPYRNMPANLHDSTFVAEKTVDFLKNRRIPGKPFLAVASFPDPHFPFNPPKEYYDKFKDMEIEIPKGKEEDLIGRPPRYMEHYRREYYPKGTYGPAYEIDDEITRKRIISTHAMNNLIDDCVGKIMKALKDENLVDDTLVIYTSDHGELLGDFGLWYKGEFFFDCSINVPLIMSNPSLKGGGAITDMVSSIDIIPTALGFAGIDLPAFSDGLSHFERIIHGGKWQRDYTLTEYRGKEEVNCICYTDKEYKFVYYENGNRELTDRINDPDELRNIYHEEPDTIVRYEKKLLQALVETKSDYPEYTGKA